MTTPAITLTGADERTDVASLSALVNRPGVEIGLLFSASNTANRYPSVQWLQAAVLCLRARCSVHICGKAARAQAAEGAHPWIQDAGRVQLNGHVGFFELMWWCDRYPTVVTQYAFTPPLDVPVMGNQILMDASGGRGVSPAEWWRPETKLKVGFAGGLGPDNLLTELPRIAAVARGEWWVDMESKLRRDDWFDAEIAGRCVDLRDKWAANEIARLRGLT